jgi:hypothetical protein
VNVLAQTRTGFRAKLIASVASAAAEVPSVVDWTDNLRITTRLAKISEFRKTFLSNNYEKFGGRKSKNCVLSNSKPIQPAQQ